jgi:hypothetical protein
MSAGKQQASERAAQVAAIRAAQRRKEQRTKLITIGAVLAVVLVLAGAATAVIVGEMRQRSALDDAAAKPIDGVVEATFESSVHVPGLPEPTPGEDGTLLPPSGGDHEPVWQNCGVYTEPIGTYNAVHSLEHGAVWITYSPDLAADQVSALGELVAGKAYTLLSPLPNLASPVVLTAWGLQLELDDVADPRAEVFLRKYVQGPQAPEPGASCSGGVGNPA